MVLKQMIRHQPPRRLPHPLEQAEVLKAVRAENLQHLERLLVAQVLDEVAHVLGHDPHVAGGVVEGAGGALGGEDGDPRAAGYEEGPLVRVGVPVHLAQGSRVDG